MRIILASASPRRKELLHKLFENFEVIPARGEEVSTKEFPEEIVQELSAQKAEEAERQLYGISCMDMPDDGEYLLLGADTVAAADGRILGKPQDEQDAADMLRMLQGAVHQVYTGVTIILCREGRRTCMQFAECTNVSFYPMTEEEILDYIRTKEPMDKAGSYGIQGIGGRFVERIDGDYSNVIGLPTSRIYQILKNQVPFKAVSAKQVIF